MLFQEAVSFSDTPYVEGVTTPTPFWWKTKSRDVGIPTTCRQVYLPSTNTYVKTMSVRSTHEAVCVNLKATWRKMSNHHLPPMPVPTHVFTCCCQTCSYQATVSGKVDYDAYGYIYTATRVPTGPGMYWRLPVPDRTTAPRARSTVLPLLQRSKMMMNWCLTSSDVSWHIRDKLWPMPKHCSIILYVHGNQKAG